MIELGRVLRDEPVRREVAAIVRDGTPLPKGREWDVTPAMVEDVLAGGGAAPAERSTRPYTEAVIREFMRPVLLVRNNRIELPRSSEIRSRILPTRAQLEARLASVGRVEFVGNPQYRWGGTGWVIADNVIVTNRHVAELIVRRSGRRFPFRLNVLSGDAMQARTDFREEYTRPGAATTSQEIAVKRALFMERDVDTSPDIAFFELAPHRQREVRVVEHARARRTPTEEQDISRRLLLHR